ncbi:MAG TPA: DUF3857 domain-containing protein [Phenylobacterium sp.]|nr:DUF3857 domain-containing protein [Phenylobacterium sp.]
MTTIDSTALAEPQVMFSAAPDWGEVPPFAPPGRASPAQGNEGRCFWLSDTQICLTGDRPVWLSRIVSEVTSPDGLQAAATIDLDFDPAFERLTIHHVRVLRDGEVREVDVRLGLEIFRRERDLERARYDGRLTAHMAIPDIRVGDVVDLCHSIEGQNRVLGDRFAAAWALGWPTWMAETRVRLLHRAGRQLSLRSLAGAPQPRRSERPDGSVELVWLARDTAPITPEPDVPGWVAHYPTVRVTDVMSWADVADTFRGGYVTTAPLSNDLEAEVATISAASADPAVRAVMALRLVQSGLRYQAVNIGDGGFVPRPIDRIWASRSGDCKDASRLLAALMRRLGLEADTVLVNTWRGWVLNEEAPSLTAFDHCIVGLKLEGKRYWLDPTRFSQGGRLEVLHQSRFGWALPLVADAELEAMGDEPLIHVYEACERFDLPEQPDLPGGLTVRTTYRGWRADAMRRRIQNGVASLATEFVDYYDRVWGPVAALEPLAISDDLEENQIDVVERYSIGRGWEKGPDGAAAVFETFDDLFRPHLTAVRSSDRRSPIDLGLPRRVTVETEIHIPDGSSITAWARIFKAPGVEVRSKFVAEDERGLVTRLSRSVEVDRLWIGPEDAEQYFNLRDDAFRSASVFLTRPLKNGRFSPPSETTVGQDWRQILGWVARVGIISAMLGALHMCNSPPA